MLVVSRFEGQSIVFPELGIKVKFIRTKSNGAAQIGIECPRRIICHRLEVQQRIEAEAKALKQKPGDQS